ncbi:MAG: hypothetical protein ABSB33_03025 [Tepidisphaeraceae bacterium]|jgi:hypothetical protein
MFQSIDTENADLAAAFSADGTELESLASGATPMESGLSDELISDEILDEYPGPPEAEETWAARDFKVDSAASDVSAEIYRRRKLMGNSYPFDLDRSTLRYRGSATLVYEFCLATACAPRITEGNFVRLPRNFERIVAIIVGLYLGTDAVHRIGDPTDDDDPPGHPRTFVDRMKYLRDRSAENAEEWLVEPEFGFDAEGKNAKDMGLDIVVWKDFPDRRVGRATMIGQCACGKNDITSDAKMRENLPERYATSLRRMTWSPPFRFYAVPFHLPNDARFKKMHSTGGLALDRARLSMIAEVVANQGKFQPLRQTIVELIRLVIPNFQVLAPTV